MIAYEDSSDCVHENGWYVTVPFWIFKKRVYVCSDCGDVLRKTFVCRAYRSQFSEGGALACATELDQMEAAWNAAGKAERERFRELLEAIENALKMGFAAAEVLDDNSPIRDGIRSELKLLRAPPANEGE